MSDFIQLGAISFDDLADEDQLEWLEDQSDELNRCFVEVTEGDASKVYAFDASEIWTIDELMDSDYAGACYVAVDKDLTDADDIERLRSVREESGTNGFGLLYFRPVGE